MDGVTKLAVAIEVKTCSIEKCTDVVLKKFVNHSYKDGLIIRDVAGIVTSGKLLQNIF